MPEKKAKRLWIYSLVFYICFIAILTQSHDLMHIPVWASHTLFVFSVFPLLWTHHRLLAIKRADLEHLVEERTHQLEKALRAAQAASKTKSDFLANMSHELRTPLNAILGFSSAMQHEAFGPLNNATYKEYATRIYKSGEHLLMVINDILDLSKIEANRQSVKSEWVDIDTVLEDVMQIVSGYPDANKRTIRIEKHEALPKLLADVKLVRQMLLNLLSNAIKFTTEKGRIKIGVGLTDDGEFWVRVTDNGIGIPQNKLTLVLSPFSQVENVLTRTHKGSGLGLALVDRIIHLHGGRMLIESEENKRTEVTLFFPAMRVEKMKSVMED